MNDLELVISKNESDLYMYDLEKNISITGIYDFYNNSDLIINFTIFIMKKPFWHK